MSDGQLQINMQPRIMTSQPVSVLQGAIPIMSSGMPQGMLNPMGHTGAMLSNSAPKFIVGNPSMMSQTPTLMQVIQQRDRDQEQQKNNGTDNKHQQNVKWVAQPVSAMGQQPNIFMQQQPTFIMGNQQMAQFGQYPGQFLTLQPQGFMSPQGVGSGFPNVIFADQLMQPRQNSILQQSFTS
jgi:hypothetical protein